MKTINKIFMVIAMIILTPTVLLVAFILIADITDMDLKGIVKNTEVDAEFLGGDMIVMQPNDASVDAPVYDQTDSQAGSDSNHLAENPPADWEPTENNSALQRQLNTDAWIESPSSSGRTDDTYDPTADLPDPDDYVRAYLNVVFKDNPSAYINYKIGTEEEAEELYRKAVDEDTINEIFGTLGFEEIQAEERLELMERILANVRYEVSESAKQDDGSYLVVVAYEKMNIYVPAVDAYIKKAENLIAGWNRTGSSGGEVPTYEKMNEQLIEAYTECLKEAFSNATYDASQNAAIRLKVVNGAYELNEEDAAEFGSKVIDTKAAMEKLEKAVAEWDF